MTTALDMVLKKKWAKNAIAVSVIFLTILAGLWYLSYGNFGAGGYETGKVTLSDLVNSKSERRVDNVTVVASDTLPFYALIATPVALYYDNDGQRAASPLLVVDPKDPSKAPLRFLDMYGLPEVYGIGPLEPLSQYNFQINHSFDGDPTSVSIAVARYFWDKSDGAVLVKYDYDGHNMGEGYSAAVTGVIFAAYLNIPVIVTPSLDSEVVTLLKDLGVKYTIICGPMGGYKKTMHIDNIDDFETWWEVEEMQIGVVRERLGGNVTYIAVGNPLDTYRKEVLESKTYTFQGTITNSDAAAYPGAAPANSNDNPIHYFDIPPDYKYANVCIDMYIDTSQERLGDASGARMYAFVGIDGNEDGMIDTEGTVAEDKLYFFGGTPAYENIGPNGGGNIFAKNSYGHMYTELPFYNHVDKNGNPYVKHAIQLLARLPTDPDYTSTYKVTIRVEKLSAPTYPLMEDLSCMAPYLAAYRMGIVTAKEGYQLHDVGYIGCSGCGVPAENKDVLDEANEQVWEVKRDLDYLLGKLAGIEVKFNRTKEMVNGEEVINITVADDTRAKLADHYRSMPIDQRPNIAIIADTNMVPQYYYHSDGQGDPTEGFGIPSDIIYQDIDTSRTEPPKDIGGRDPDFELPVGRVDGWDAQDVSALIARTFFYDQIIATYKGPYNSMDPRMGQYWKDSGFTTIGTEPPVGAAETAAKKLGLMFQAAGLQTKSDIFVKQDESRRQRAGPYYESANYIYFCAHGFYYWYVPSAVEGTYGPLPDIAAGGAFDVAHVKDMNFGPSVLWASSCVTGRIDGLDARLTLSQAFLHSGLNAYIGATRESWGVIVPSPDTYSGEKLGDLMALYFYGHLIGKMYDKHGGMVSYEPGDLTVGQALTLAKNEYVAAQGSDNGGENDDTFEEFILHGDPAFNPYEPINT